MLGNILTILNREFGLLNYQQCVSICQTLDRETLTLQQLHILIWTEFGLVEANFAKNLQIIFCKPKFLCGACSEFSEIIFSCTN